MNTLYRQLKDYSESDYYGFHMPGHKRNKRLMNIDLPYEMDITEIEGFDDLHHADGILKSAQERAARVYGADESHFLINGSTVGILSAILGNTRKGDSVLVARHCHKSVYHAIFMNELKPVYLYPEFRGDLQLNTEISVSAVQTALKEHLDIRAVIIVSPTYEGVISDVEGIAKVVHEKGIPLIVDEAHGAHLGFHPYFDKNSNAKGADVVIQSLHKTLPSLTQTAILHINGSYANRKKIRRYLDMLQSSSPSYILMASIDECIDMLANRREEIFDYYADNLSKFWENTESLKRLAILQTEHFDRSKIVISVKNTDITSKELYRILLDKYHLQMEMVSGTYVLAMTSVGDSEEGLERLWKALVEIDAEIDERMSVNDICIVKREGSFLPRTERVYTSAQIYAMQEEEVGSMASVKWEDSEGCISTEYAYLYPPGSPLIVPGERISQDVIDRLMLYRRLHFAIEGLRKEGYIEVWKNG